MKMLEEPKFRMATETHEQAVLGLRVVRIIHGYDGVAAKTEKPDCVQKLKMMIPWRGEKSWKRHFCSYQIGSKDADLIADEKAWMRSAKIVLEDSNTERGALIRAWLWRVVRILGLPVYGRVPETSQGGRIHMVVRSRSTPERIKQLEEMARRDGDNLIIIEDDGSYKYLV